MVFLRKLFSSSEIPAMRSTRDFDLRMIKANVIDYHLRYHRLPGQKVDLSNCHAKYDGGDKVTVGVPFFSDSETGGKFYVYDLVTGEIDDDIGDFFASA
jgi:hypothetical protein